MAFVDQDEFEAMKTLSGRRAPRCDKDQFRAKMTVSKVRRGNLERNLVLGAYFSYELRWKSGMMLLQEVHLCPSQPSGVHKNSALFLAYV